MTRLIDAAALSDVLNEDFEYLTTVVGNLDQATGVSMAQLAVASAPTVDAVEVVRCGNCKHFHEVNSTSRKGCAWGNCRKHSSPCVFANEFCSRGERSE